MKENFSFSPAKFLPSLQFSNPTFLIASHLSQITDIYDCQGIDVKNAQLLLMSLQNDWKNHEYAVILK